MSEIVAIGATNIKYYKNFLSPGVLEEAERDGDVYMFGIESDGLAAGAAAVKIEGPEASLLWFALHPDFRGLGIGNEGFGNLLAELKKMEVAFLTANVAPGIDPKVVRLFQGYHPEVRELFICEVHTTVGAVAKLEKLKGVSKNTKALKDVDPPLLKQYGDGLAKYNRDLIPLPIKKKDYLGLLSSVYLKNGEIKAALLFRRKEETNTLQLSFIGSITKAATAIMNLFYYSFAQITKLPAKTAFSICIVEEHARKLMDYLFSELEENEYEIRPMQEYRVNIR